MPQNEKQQVLKDISIINLDRPYNFNHRSTAGRRLHTAYEREVNLSEEEILYLNLAFRVLTHPALRRLARKGEVTLALIKPNLYQGKNFGLDEDVDLEMSLPVRDDQAAHKIRSEIERTRRNADGTADKGEILLDINMQFTKEQAEEFYKQIKDNFIAGGHSDIWSKINSHMTGGPLTFLLIRHLHRSAPGEDWTTQDDAVNWWRKRIGATNPQNAARGTIRRRFANSIDNNIVHGSDSKESAAREISLIGGFLKEYADLFMHPRSSHNSEATLHS